MSRTNNTSTKHIGKLLGTSYELTFSAEALRHGLYPHLPVGDVLQHDVLVQNREGKATRVQVKGTCSPAEAGRRRRRKGVMIWGLGSTI
jgi:hypothetical protein